MRAKFLSTSLLSLALCYPILATSSQEDNGPPPAASSTCAPLCEELKNARTCHKMGDFKNADYWWCKLLNTGQERSPDVTDKDLAKALVSHMITTTHDRTPENTARINGLMTLLPQDALVHACLMLHMNDAALDDVDFAMQPLLKHLQETPGAAPELIETLRTWVNSYALKNTPFIHKGYDALFQMCDLLLTPPKAIDHLGRGMAYMRAYVLSNNSIDLYQASASYCAAGPLLSTPHERKRFHQLTAESLMLQSHLPSISPSHSTKLGQDAVNHWHQYWACQEEPSFIEHGIYVRGVIKANIAAQRRDLNLDMLDFMPDELHHWDILTLIYATEMHLEIQDIPQATLYWQEAIKKAELHDDPLICGPLVNLSLLEIGRKMAFGGQLDLAIKTLETSLKLDTMQEISTKGVHALFNGDTEKNLEQKRQGTHLMLAFALSQKAMACKDPQERKGLFERAMDSIRTSHYHTSVSGTQDEVMRILAALYFMVLEAGSPTERKNILPSILGYLIQNSVCAHGTAPKRIPSHSRRKAPSLEDKGTQARGSLMKAYGTFAAQELEKLARLEQKLPLLGAPELYEATKDLKAQLVTLRDAAKRPVRTQETAHVCLETTSLYNAAHTQVQAYTSLWKSIKREIAKARAALPAPVIDAFSSPVPSSSSSAPNNRNAYPHTKRPKAKKTQARTRLASAQPSSSSSSTPDSAILQEAPPASVRIVFSSQAEADRDILLTMPGMASKLDLFQNEIMANPFATKINMASGRAEALRFMKDHYSKRFDKQNRLVYRTDRNEDGSVTVTVLRLLSHYKM